MDKFYLTTPIYYVNAEPHIGHAYTTLIADVMARYYRDQLSDQAVFFLTGTDEHGAKIAEVAAKNNLTPLEFCNQMSPKFRQAWKNLGIEYSRFIRTTDPDHEQNARDFLVSLKNKQALYQADYHGLYCTGCESFLLERQLTKDGFCPDHQRPPEAISEKNWFFKLADYLPVLEQLIADDQLLVAPSNSKEEVLGLLRQELADFSVSRPSVSWGIKLPWDDQQTIYVWVEALLNYWTGLRQGYGRQADPLQQGYGRQAAVQQGSLFNKFWPPDLQLIGKDIIKFHCIYWPAMLLAYYDGDTRHLPRQIFAHGFYTINGQKMSKTIGNVIDPNNLVAKYGVDGARYLILSQFPIGTDGDIEESKFTEKFNADLANGIGNLLSRVTVLVGKKIQNHESLWKSTEIISNNTRIKYDQLMSELKIFEVIKLINKIVQESDELLAATKPWQLDAVADQPAVIKTLSHVLFALTEISSYLTPILPATARAISERLNQLRLKQFDNPPLFPRIT